MPFQAALAEDRERVKALVDEYRSYFGHDNLYFELMDFPNVPGQAEVNQQRIASWQRIGVPVATNNSHYCRPKTLKPTTLLCIQKNANVNDASQAPMRDSDFSMPTSEEMMAKLPTCPKRLPTRARLPTAAPSTLFGLYKIPKFSITTGETEEELLRTKCEEGLRVRHPCMHSRGQLPQWRAV